MVISLRFLRQNAACLSQKSRDDSYSQLSRLDSLCHELGEPLLYSGRAHGTVEAGHEVQRSTTGSGGRFGGLAGGAIFVLLHADGRAAVMGADNFSAHEQLQGRDAVQHDGP